MINPSAPGWIDKFFIDQNSSDWNSNLDEKEFYINLINSGFIYGHIIGLNAPNSIDFKGWFKEEVSKVALLVTLLQAYILTKKNSNWKEFIAEAVDFYEDMHPEGFNLFKLLLPKNSISLSLEKIIDERVQTNDNIVSKNFSHLVTNALLFIDVLAFRQYLINGSIPEKYCRKIEETLVQIVTLALKIKSNKSQYDNLLIKLFEASIRYSKFSKDIDLSMDMLSLNYFTHELEKKYLMDIAGMALWSDGQIEKIEIDFLYQLSEYLSISPEFVAESIQKTNSFIQIHKKEIPYFNYSNPVKHFYDQTTQSVLTLLSRNKTRLRKEIFQSKELMVLIAESARRDLDEKEKKKIKKQLLDICKSIPSFAIFLLPGGSLLLPILIKFIPTLLPSAFNENLDSE